MGSLPTNLLNCNKPVCSNFFWPTGAPSEPLKPEVTTLTFWKSEETHWFKKTLFVHHWRTILVNNNQWQKQPCRWDEGRSPWRLALSWESTIGGLDFLSVLLRLLARAEKEKRQEEWFVDCRPRAGGLPPLLFSGLVLRGGWERGEILPWHCKMRNDTVSPNVAPHRAVMD